ncbi:MAG: YfhO family protein [Lachnospiraceae bacterium]|nr:YfhO family protein [Lachnospiraceae bacterium]
MPENKKRGNRPPERIARISRRTLVHLAILIGAACFIVFFQYLFGKKLFVFLDIGSDTAEQYLPHYMTIVKKLREGDFTLWDSNNGFGVNMNMLNMTNPALMILYFLGFLVGEKNIPYLIVYIYILEIFAAGISCYFYLSVFALREKSKLLSSYMYAFSGFMMVWGQHYQFAVVPTLLVLEMLMIERVIRDKRRWKALALMTAVTVMSSMYIAYMILLFCGLYVCVRFFFRKLKGLPGYIGDVFSLAWPMALGVGLSMFTLLPAVAAILSVSSRLQSSESLWERLFGFTYPKGYYQSLIYRLFSSTIRGITQFEGFRNFYEDPNLFFSTLFILLAIQFVIFLPKMKRFNLKQKICLILLLLTALLSVLTPAAGTVMNGFVGPFSRYFFLYLPGFSLIAAYALDEIFERRRASIAGILIGLLILSRFYIVSILPGPIVHPRYVFAAHLAGGWGMGILLFLFGRREMKKYRKLIYQGLILLLFLNCMTDSLSCVLERNNLDKGGRYVSELADAETREALSWIRENDDQYYRIEKTYGATVAMDSMAMNYHPVSTYNSTQNAFIQYYVRDYWPDLIYADVNHYVYTLGIANRSQSDLVGVKYVLARTPDAGIEGMKAAAQCGEVTIYQSEEVENIASFYALKDVQDSITVEPDGRTRQAVFQFEERDRESGVSIVDDGRDDRVSGTVSAAEDGLLFIAIPYEQGWSVYIDGKKAEKLKGNEGFTAVEVPQGAHTFEMKYLVPGLLKGLLLSFLSAAFFAFYAVIDRKRGEMEALSYLLALWKR